MEDASPAVTLKGRNLVEVALTRDKVFALAKNGTVYFLNANQGTQDADMAERKKNAGSWLNPLNWFSSNEERALAKLHAPEK
jgi:hypothetical protein